MGHNLMDEIDCGNFFDQIDDLIEFPPDNNEGDNGNLVGSGDCNDFSSMWNEAFPESDPIFSSSHAASDLSAELSVPYEDIVQLEWLSNFVEDSFSGSGMTLGKESVCTTTTTTTGPLPSQFQTSSPVSVLESSSSYSGPGKSAALSPTHHGPQRARSKRPRPATFNRRAAIQLISPSSSFIETPGQPLIPPVVSSDSENFAESLPAKRGPKPAGAEPKKKKKIKITLPADPEESTRQDPPAQSVRKCMHCEITKTPQWRAGPMGPKTLCNACGVRYKSGRLFPEYRPAASPTFVPSLHSNSHKKVLEMRGKAGTGPAPTSAATPKAAKPETGPNE